MKVNQMAHSTTAAIQSLWADRPANRERVKSFHQNMQVNGWYLVLPQEECLQPSDLRAGNRTWIDITLELAEKVVCPVLDPANLSAELVLPEW